jgi:hypothetical protein
MLLKPRADLYLEFMQLNRAEGDANAIGICDAYEQLPLAAEADFRDHLNSQFVEHLGLAPQRVHVLLDLPIERGRIKFGEDVNVITYRGEPRALVKVSGIVHGAQTGFREHLQRLRVFVHPESLDQIKRSAKEERAKGLIQKAFRSLN